MKNNFKSAMDQIKPDPEMLEQIIEKVERQESGGKNMFWKKKFVKYGVIAATITLLATGGVVVTMAAVNSGEETEVVEEPKTLTQDELKNMMINSIDYYSSAKGEFTYSSTEADYDYTISYEVSTKEGKYASHVVSTNNTYGVVEENWYDGTTNTMIDHTSKTYQQYNQDSLVLESEAQTFEDSVGVTPEGDPITNQRPDPTLMGMATNSLFPQNYAFSYLGDNSTWSIIGYEEYLGRNVAVIEGTDCLHAYEESFKMWIDVETGVMLKFESYDTNGEVIESLETTSIEFDDPTVNAIDYTAVIPDDYENVTLGYVGEDYASVKGASSSIFIFTPVEEVGTVFYGTDIYTRYNVEVVEVIESKDIINGEVNEISGVVTIDIPGGSATAEEYYNNLLPENAELLYPDGPESIPEEDLVSDPENTVSIEMGEQYIALADMNGKTEIYKIEDGAYGVYKIEGDHAVNEYTGEVVQSSDF